VHDVLAGLRSVQESSVRPAFDAADAPPLPQTVKQLMVVRRRSCVSRSLKAAMNRPDRHLDRSGRRPAPVRAEHFEKTLPLAVVVTQDVNRVVARKFAKVRDGVRCAALKPCQARDTEIEGVLIAIAADPNRERWNCVSGWQRAENVPHIEQSFRSPQPRPERRAPNFLNLRADHPEQ